MSVTSVYNKLQQMEPGTSAGLVGWSAQRATELIEEVGGQRTPLLAGFTVKVIDGNALDGRSTRTPAVKRTHDPGRTHFSVARTLQQRKAKAP